MILEKDELISSIRGEVPILLHLISKIDPSRLDHRPTPGQRSILELVRYLAIMAPIHLRAILADRFDMDGWTAAWTEGEAAAKAMNLEQAATAIAAQQDLVSGLLAGCPEERLRETFEMFGMRSSRAALVVRLVLCHYTAYRMQLFLYLKASGREELGTLNLWAGRDTW
jgi:hypothetical protein